MVGCIVLSGVVFGMGMTMHLIRSVGLMGNVDCAKTMRRRDHDRSHDKRKQKHDPYGNPCRARLRCAYVRVAFHDLPDLVVVLSPLGG